jgi:hypothetical protein
MKFYIHPINPHYAATHADDYFEGWKFGIWEHPYPALEPGFYRFQSKHLEAARDTQQQAEQASRDIPDLPVKGEWLTPTGQPGPLWRSRRWSAVLSNGPGRTCNIARPESLIDSTAQQVLQTCWAVLFAEERTAWRAMRANQAER